jgi:hypothetical protein
VRRFSQRSRGSRLMKWLGGTSKSEKSHEAKVDDFFVILSVGGAVHLQCLLLKVISNTRHVKELM